MTEFSANSINPYEGILILAITEHTLYLKLRQWLLPIYHIFTINGHNSILQWYL